MEIHNHFEMMLSELASTIGLYIENTQMVTKIHADLDSVGPGDLWVSPRPTVHQCQFAKQKGCVAVFCRDKPLYDGVVILQHHDYESALGIMLSAFYHDASSFMNILAVTGTNGKTTVAYLCAAAMQFLQEESVYIGTLGYGRYGNLKPQQLTTPACGELHYKVATAYQDGAKFIAMEASSHGLDQGRLAGLSIDVGVFTNLTHEHLDYHKTINDYLAAKQKLFMMSSVGVAVINYDDQCGTLLIDRLNKAIWPCSMQSIPRGFERWSYASIKEKSLRGMKIKISTPKTDDIIQTPLIGAFNAENIMYAHAALCALGVSSHRAAKALGKVDMIPGRMQRIKYAELSCEVIVDFAHTPNALERVLTQLNTLQKGRLWLVFGCGGDRDREKRPLMGRIAERLADEVILTEDNSRSEELEGIIKEIQLGMRCPTFSKIIYSRFQAIRYALREAQESDIILLAGMGNEQRENSMIPKGSSDVELVEAVLVA